MGCEYYHFKSLVMEVLILLFGVTVCLFVCLFKLVFFSQTIP